MVLPFLAAIAPFAPLIGGAIGAMGQLMAPKPKAQTVTNSIDLNRLRSDAEAAGFNPLTIIRGGGLAGYGSQHIPAGPDMRLSNALSTFGSGVAQWQYDPYATQKSQMELRLAEAQIQSYARTGAPSGLSLGGVPKAEGVVDRLYKTVTGSFLRGEETKAEVIEADYGEGVAEATGWTNYVVDLYRNWNAPEMTISWGPNGWKPDPRGTKARIFTGGGF